MLSKAGTRAIVVGIVTSLGSLLAVLITDRPFLNFLLTGLLVLLFGVR